MACIITYKGKKYSEEQFKEHFINNKQEFTTSIAKNKDVIDSFKRKMEGIDFIFSQSPELASIGSKAQYLQYLSTIFPNSKVKDIVYHGTDKKFDKFDKTKTSKTLFADGTLTQKDVIYFSKDKEIGTNLNEKPKVVLSAIVNLKESITVVGKRLEDKISREIAIVESQLMEAGLAKNKELYDNLKQQKEILKTKQSNLSIYVGNITKENLEKIKKEYPEIDGIIWGNKEIVVFEPEQIHILSSKKDLEMFKNFINLTKSEYAKHGDIQQFRDYIMSKNFAAIEEFLVVNNKIDRKC